MANNAEAERFSREAIRAFVNRTAGYSTHSNKYALIGVSASHEQRILEWPVDTTFQSPLRNKDGTRNYPADLGGTDNGTH